MKKYIQISISAFVCLLIVGLIMDSQLLVLAVTAGIVLLYTYETYKLREATVNQTDINTRPVLALYIDQDMERREATIWIENFGNFPAYNARCEESQLKTLSTSQDPLEYDLKFELDFIPPKGKAQIFLGHSKSTDRIDNKELFSIVNWQKVKKAPYELRTIVTYDDISSQSWKCELEYNGTIGIIAKTPNSYKRENRKGGDP
jgi:hypothetical protein